MMNHRMNALDKKKNYRRKIENHEQTFFDRNKRKKSLKTKKEMQSYRLPNYTQFLSSLFSKNILIQWKRNNKLSTL